MTTEEEKAPRMTSGMRWALVGVGVVVVVGAIVTGVLLTAEGGPGGASSGQSTPTRGPLPDATPTSGSEVLAPTDAPADNVLPPRETAAPADPVTALIAPPFPGSATADGELATGYPVDVMGPLNASDVISSAIATEGDVMQVTLEARSDTAVADVQAFYAAKWAALGLTPQQTPDGSFTYVGRGAALSLSAKEGGTGIRYTVIGVFRGV